MSHDSTSPPQRAGHGPRNVAVIIVVSATIGLAVAVYENVLPIYLDRVNISFSSMGWIFSAAALIACAVRIGAGWWSDRVGRKIVYGLSLLLQGAAMALTPLFSSALVQGFLKSVREPAMHVRETLHSVLVYEGAQKRFVEFFGKSRGAEFLFRFLGLLLAAFAFQRMEARGVGNPAGLLILSSGLLILLGTTAFTLGYRETGFRPVRRTRLRPVDLLRPRLNRALWLLTGAEFVFQIGLTCSHCFAMQHFFLKKFHVSAGGVLVIMALHRLSIALPLFFVGRIVKRRFKETYMAFLLVEGSLIAIPGFLPGLYLAAGVWLLHDLFGAGLWLPAQHMLLQRCSRPDMRGRQVSLVLALGSMGRAIGPLVAGYLMSLQLVSTETAVSLPFVAGGLLVALPAALVAFLRV